MTLNGAIMQLVEMRENSMMPVMFKPYFDKIIETVSECVEPSEMPHWIPCSERLPEYDKPVLISTAWGKTEIGFWTQSGWMIIACSYREFEQDAVAAWMPLPEPYKAERREE